MIANQLGVLDLLSFHISLEQGYNWWVEEIKHTATIIVCQTLTLVLGRRALALFHTSQGQSIITISLVIAITSKSIKAVIIRINDESINKKNQNDKFHNNYFNNNHNIEADLIIIIKISAEELSPVLKTMTAVMHSFS